MQFKQRAVIEFLTVGKIPPIYIHHHMQALCWDKYVDISRFWVWQFKWEEMGKTSLCDTAGSGRPVIATDKSHQKWVEKMIWENHQIKQKDIAIKLGISKEGVGHVINLLGFQKVHARWAMKTDWRDESCKKFWVILKRKVRWFLWWVVTGDETWVHHCDPESKRQAMEYCRNGSPAPKKFKTEATDGKVKLTVFWNYEVDVHTDFLEKHATVNTILKP